MLNDKHMIAYLTGEIIAPPIEDRALAYIDEGLRSAHERGDTKAIVGWNQAKAVEHYAQTVAIAASLN